jgi:hypothetical protein
MFITPAVVGISDLGRIGVDTQNLRSPKLLRLIQGETTK